MDEEPAMSTVHRLMGVVVIVLLFVSCVSSTMNDSSGCADHIDQYGACVQVDQP